MKLFATLAIAAALTVTSSATDEVETTYPINDRCKFEKLWLKLYKASAKRNAAGVKIFTEVAVDPPSLASFKARYDNDILSIGVHEKGV